MAGYYRRFIENFSKIAKSLTILTQKTLPDGPEDFVVYYDASGIGLSMCVMQEEYDGKGGVVVLTRWIEKMESVQDMSGCSIDQKVKYTAGSFVEEFCPSHEMQKLETEMWNHVIVGVGHAAYTNRFHELARLVPRLVTLESRKIERYAYGFAPQIRGMVAACHTPKISGDPGQIPLGRGILFGVGMGFEIIASDVREDDEKFEAEASSADTRETAVDPLAIGDSFETSRGASQLVASGERASLVERIRSLRLEYLKVQAMLSIERDRIDSIRWHMALSQEEFRQVRRDRDDTRRRLRRLESYVERHLGFRP
ncbi:hypothetical protein Tco_1376173 [Tanacetum coccineum]